MQLSTRYDRTRTHTHAQSVSQSVSLEASRIAQTEFRRCVQVHKHCSAKCAANDVFAHWKAAKPVNSFISWRRFVLFSIVYLVWVFSYKQVVVDDDVKHCDGIARARSPVWINGQTLMLLPWNYLCALHVTLLAAVSSQKWSHSRACNYYLANVFF